MTLEEDWKVIDRWVGCGVDEYGSDYEADMEDYKERKNRIVEGHIDKQKIRDAIKGCSRQLLQFNEQKLIIPEQLLKELNLDD